MQQSDTLDADFVLVEQWRESDQSAHLGDNRHQRARNRVFARQPVGPHELARLHAHAAQDHQRDQHLDRLTLDDALVREYRVTTVSHQSPETRQRLNTHHHAVHLEVKVKR